MLLQQKAGEGKQGLIVFDYHVILAKRFQTYWQICDLDSRLGTKSAWPIYRENTFPRLPVGYERFTPTFRVLSASLYHDRFASDRSHMRERDGSWSHPPPPWPTIGKASNLMQFIDVQQSFFGELIDLDALDDLLSLP